MEEKKEPLEQLITTSGVAVGVALVVPILVGNPIFIILFFYFNGAYGIAEIHCTCCYKQRRENFITLLPQGGRGNLLLNLGNKKAEKKSIIF